MRAVRRLQTSFAFGGPQESEVSPMPSRKKKQAARSGGCPLDLKVAQVVVRPAPDSDERLRKLATLLIKLAGESSRNARQISTTNNRKD